MKEFVPLALTVSMVLLAGCSRSGPRDDAEAGRINLSKVVVALKPDKNPEAMIEEKNALESFLSERLGRPVQVIVPLSSSVIIEGFSNGTVDLGYVSATEMVFVREKESVSILLAGEINGNTHYESYWVSLAEKPYNDVADLRGKPVAFASKTSTSGNIIPHWDLIKKGLLPEGGDPELFFGRGNVWYGTGYVSAIERVLSGNVEAAAVSYYVLDEDKHLTLEQRKRLKKVSEQGPVPTHVIAVRAKVSAPDRALLKQALESLNEPPHTELRDKLFTSKLVEVNADAHLQPLRDALKLTGKL